MYLSRGPFRPEVLATVGKSKARYEAETNERQKAVLSQKYLALLLYTEIPPQRAKEYQTMVLRVFKKGRLPRPGKADPTMPNSLCITDDGSEGYLQIADYKTCKTHGEDYVPLEDAPIFFRHLFHHLSVHREVLVTDSSVKHLFVVRRESQYM